MLSVEIAFQTGEAPARRHPSADSSLAHPCLVLRTLHCPSPKTIPQTTSSKRVESLPFVLRQTTWIAESVSCQGCFGQGNHPDQPRARVTANLRIRGGRKGHARQRFSAPAGRGVRLAKKRNQPRRLNHWSWPPCAQYGKAPATMNGAWPGLDRTYVEENSREGREDRQGEDEEEFFIPGFHSPFGA